MFSLHVAQHFQTAERDSHTPKARVQHLAKTDEIGIVSTSTWTASSNNWMMPPRFVKAIGEGQLDAKLAGENQEANSQAFVNMQQKLRSINEEEQSESGPWRTRQVCGDYPLGRIERAALGDNIIKALVTYTSSNAGGLYVWNDDHADDQYLSWYRPMPFNRKSLRNRKIKAGEGVVGSYLEQLTTHLTEIPPDYFRIVSGLGRDGPLCDFDCAVDFRQQNLRLVELASLKKFEAHEIAFVEKLGETLASPYLQ